MNKRKLLRTILIPTLGVLAIGAVPVVATSCSCGKQESSPYVIINAKTESIFTLINNGENDPDLKYSLDGNTWNEYSEAINIGTNQSLFLKGYNPEGWSKSDENYSKLFLTGDVSISGNVMGLLDNGAKDGDAGNITDIPNDLCFNALFATCESITSVSDDFLPSKNLTKSCYELMFYNCKNLVQAPSLPATILAENCYHGLFLGCQALTSAPVLPVTTLVKNCYDSMFEGCASLVKAPDLPATTLSNNCYILMFANCTSLVQAPALPVTALASNCYDRMFLGCTSLVNSPDLPATTLADYCYYGMFNGCSALNSIKIGYEGTVAAAPENAFLYWVEGVSTTGTFYYKGSDTLANFGFPTGEGTNWTINSEW